MTYSTGSKILASDFTTSKDALNNFIGPSSGARGATGYGQTAVGGSVAASNKINASNWAQLVDKLKGVLEHQQTPYTPMTTPTAGSRITANPALAANFALATSPTNIFSGGIATSDLITTTNPASFNLYGYQTLTIGFGSHQSASHFFNAGGQIDVFTEISGDLAGTAAANGRMRWGGAGYLSAATSQKIDGVTYTGLTKISGTPVGDSGSDPINGNYMQPYRNFYAISNNINEITGFASYKDFYGRVSFRVSYGDGVLTFYSIAEPDRFNGRQATIGIYGQTLSVVVRNPTTSAQFPKTWTTPYFINATADSQNLAYEPTQVEIANYFWNYRNRLVRLPAAPQYSYYPPVDGSFPGASGNGTSFPGISNYENFYHNNYNFRYTQGRQTNNWTYANTDLPRISSYVTALSLISGATASGAGQSPHGIINSGIAPFSVVLNEQRNWAWAGDYGVGFRRQTYNADIRNISSGYIEGSSFYVNAGVWQYQFLFPGRLKYTDLALDFNPNTYSVNVGPGEFHVCIVERGGNGRQEIPPPSWPAQSAFKVISLDNWWYNGADLQIAVNTTSSTQNFTWIGPTDGYGNPTSAFPGGTGHTPRYAFKMVAEY